MIRAHRVNATAQDDASLISGWNIAPNVGYSVTLLPGATSCGVLFYDDGGLVASGAALVGTDQPCVLSPQGGYALGMIDAELGWHLLLTTTGAESQRTIRINPAVDLPDEIHPVYADEDMALVRATAGIDGASHYIDDVTVTYPLGLGAGLGDVVSVPVDGAAVVGQVESSTWIATPDGTSEQAVIRRHIAIAPEAFVEPEPITPPSVADDIVATTADEATSGNVLTNDGAGLTIVAVNGLAANVGVGVAGSAGGLFTVDSDGSWTFDPGVDFLDLPVMTSADTSVSYHASDGVGEASAGLIVNVTSAAVLVPAYVAVCGGRYHTVALRNDGTVAAIGTNNYGQCNVSDWTDIVSIAAGSEHTIGLKLDGTVIAAGRNNYGQCNVSGWSGIIKISANYYDTVGIRSDGTVAVAGRYSSPAASWTDIVDIGCGDNHIVGGTLLNTAIAAGSNTYGQCNVSDWTDIVDVAACAGSSFGLKSDGTVVGVGRDLYSVLSLSSFIDVTAISATYYNAFGRKSDGTVISSGNNDFGQRNVSTWTDIVAVTAAIYSTLGLTGSGTLVATGRNDYGQGDVYLLNDLLI